MPDTVSYIFGSTLPGFEVLPWTDGDGEPIDFTGHTFSLKIGSPGQAADFTKTDDITSSTPGTVTVAWDVADEVTTLSVGSRVLELTAIRTADSKTRRLQVPFDITPGVT